MPRADLNCSQRAYIRSNVCPCVSRHACPWTGHPIRHRAMSRLCRSPRRYSGQCRGRRCRKAVGRSSSVRSGTFCMTALVLPEQPPSGACQANNSGRLPISWPARCNVIQAHLGLLGRGGWPLKPGVSREATVGATAGTTAECAAWSADLNPSNITTIDRLKPQSIRLIKRVILQHKAHL